MRSAAFSSVLDSFLEPLSRCLDPESARRVLEFRLDPAVEARVEVLAERASEDNLTEDERAGYAAMVETADMISIFKLKARRRLQSNGD
jgi:hypothetical protein